VRKTADLRGFPVGGGPVVEFGNGAELGLSAAGVGGGGADRLTGGVTVSFPAGGGSIHSPDASGDGGGD